MTNSNSTKKEWEKIKELRKLGLMVQDDDFIGTNVNELYSIIHQTINKEVKKERERIKKALLLVDDLEEMKKVIEKELEKGE